MTSGGDIGTAGSGSGFRTTAAPSPHHRCSATPPAPTGLDADLAGVDVLCAARLLHATGPGAPAGAADRVPAGRPGDPGNRSGELLRGVVGRLGGPDGPACRFPS